jgi:hypothetical protein
MVTVESLPPSNDETRTGLLRDALARIVWIREELDSLVREQALEDLELDLAVEVYRLEERAA